MSEPSIYNLDWEPKRPKCAPSMARFFAAPVAGARVLVPFSNGFMRRCRVISVTPIGYDIERERVSTDTYVADIVLTDEA